MIRLRNSFKSTKTISGFYIKSSIYMKIIGGLRLRSGMVVAFISDERYIRFFCEAGKEKEEEYGTQPYDTEKSYTAE